MQPKLFIVTSDGVMIKKMQRLLQV